MPLHTCRRFPALLVVPFLAACAAPQETESLVAAYPADLCPSCAEWNAPHPPFQVHGNTWYVGTSGLTALLITSDEGHVLIDGGLPDSAPLILENITTLGFDPADIELILNSHAHYDHAGGIAAIQRASGARVAASASSAPVLERGIPDRDDPQHAIALPFPGSAGVGRFADGTTLRVGPIAVTAHLTAGHTPGGTSWSWRSCAGSTCLDLVYADSQTPVSADGFRFSDSPDYPTAVADFERGFAVIESLPCDILLTPHPGASSLWERLTRDPQELVDPDACRRYAESARARLARRLDRESSEP